MPFVRPLHASALLAALLLPCAAQLLPACSDDAPAPAPAGPPPFQPKGCGFKVAGRPEYVGFSEGKPDVGATPNIRRVRLGLGGNVAPGAPGRADPSTMVGIGWQTDEGTLASEVQWGTGTDPSAWPAENRSNGVTWQTPPGIVATGGAERMHEAYLCGLQPATTYSYRVGGGAPGKEVWSDVYSFTTTPKDPGTPVTFGLTGDARGQDNDVYRLLQKRLKAAGVTVGLFSGDTVNLAFDQDEWEKWLDLAWKDEKGDLLTLGSLLTLATHGNHENHTSLYFGNLILPQDVSAFPKYGELFYSVDIGPVHLVVVDDLGVAYSDEDPGYAETLKQWLRADLGAANQNRANVPWIVTMHHHSELSSSSHGKDADVLLIRSFFMPIWDEFHVDMNLAGHDHNYERSKPVTGPADAPKVQTTFDKGTVYVVCAGAGADAYGSGTSDFTEISKSYGSNGALGFYAFVKADKTSLSLEAHEVRADETDPVVDSLTITK